MKQAILNKLIPIINQQEWNQLLSELKSDNNYSNHFTLTQSFKNTNKYNKILDSYFNDLIIKSKFSNLISPYEFINNDNYHDLIKIMGLNNFIVSLKRGTNPFTKKVSNFPLIHAKTIYDYYAINNSKVLDFSAGWGSRLLAAWASHKVNTYVAFEPNINLYNRLIQFSSELNKYSNETIFNLFSISSHHTINEFINQFNLIFSSPPYFNREVYSNDQEQSINLFPTFLDWLNNYWYKTLDNCILYLKVNSYLIINIKNIKQPSYKLADLTIDYLKQQSDMKFIDILDLPINNKQSEPLIIFRKGNNE